MKEILIGLVVILTGLTGSVKEQLTAHWKFDTIVDKSIKSDELAFMNGMFSGSYLELNKNGDYLFMFMGKRDEGKWNVSEDEKEIIFNSNEGTLEHSEIVELTDTNFAFSVDKKTTIRMTKASNEEMKSFQKEEKIKKETMAEAMYETISATPAQIAKKWVIDKRDPKPRSEPSENSQLIAKLLLEGSYMNFKPNGKYKLKILGIREKGTWSLENNSTQIVTYKNGDKNSWNINSVSDNQLILLKPDDPRRWFFIK